MSVSHGLHTRRTACLHAHTHTHTALTAHPLTPSASIRQQHQHQQSPLLRSPQHTHSNSYSRAQHTVTRTAARDLPTPIVENIEERELHVEASESYLAYAMSVIVGRALPDVRDGLKPVHRRILFAMHDLGMSHTKPYRKCARVVGEVLGKYHPHGDSAVYDALVRLAQDFSMRHPLIAGHGNFGSLDDDPPAAMRYTECRLQALASDMLLTNLEEDIVDFIPTFDGSQEEPTVLPANIPHLLVNGTNGIAVGIATRISPHNLREVVAGLSAYIANQDITNAELQKLVPGPDFPTGGVLGVDQGLTDAYETGSGSVMLRAKVDVEEGEESSAASTSAPSTSSPLKRARNRRSTSTNIVMSEVPFQTSKADLVAKIAELVEAKTLTGVADVRDESDRQGVRVVVELKPGVSADVVLAALYKHTRLQSRVPFNMVALVNGAPKQLSLRDFFKHFLAFRCEVLAQRARSQLRKAQDRLHLVEGFLTAMSRLDDVVQVIRNARDTGAARTALMNEFGLSVIQADATLGLPLRRLTSMERTALEGEAQQVRASIADLQDFLASPQRILDQVDTEAQAMAHKHGSPRKTSIISEEEASGEVTAAAAAATAAAAAESEVLIMASARRFVHRVPSNAFEAQQRGGKGKLGAGLREGDCLAQVVRTTEGNRVLVITSTGHAYSIPAASIPPPSKSGYGSAIAQVLNTASSVPMVALVPLKPQDPAALLMASSHESRASKSKSRASSSAADSQAASESPSAAEAVDTLTASESRPASASSSAEADSTTASEQQQGETGNRGEAASVRGNSDAVPSGAEERFLVLLTHGGDIKRIHLTSNYYKLKKTGCSVMKVDPDNNPLGWAASCGPNDSLLVASSSGRVLLFPASEVRPTRFGGAVKGMKLQEGHRVVGMTVVPSAIVPHLATDEAEANPSQGDSLAPEHPTRQLCVLLVTASGKGKRVPLEDFRIQKRDRTGMPGIKLSRGTGDSLAAVSMVMPDDEVLLGSENGKIVRLQASAIERLPTRVGARVLMDLQEGDSVQTIAVLPSFSAA